MFFLACLFRRKSQANVIARSSLSCKIFNVACYSKSVGILAHHDKCSFKTRDIILKDIVLEYCAFLTKYFK